MLSDDELGPLLEAWSGADFYARRDLALVRLMLVTGMRVSEVCDLTIGDLDLVRRIVSVRHGKGDKARRVAVDGGPANRTRGQNA